MPDASFLLEILSLYTMEGLFYAHDQVAAREPPPASANVMPGELSLDQLYPHPSVKIVRIDKTNEPLVSLVITYFIERFLSLIAIIKVLSYYYKFITVSGAGYDLVSNLLHQRRKHLLYFVPASIGSHNSERRRFGCYWSNR